MESALARVVFITRGCGGLKAFDLKRIFHLAIESHAE